MVILEQKRKTTERNLQYHIDSYINVVARVRYICDDLRLDISTTTMYATNEHGAAKTTERARRGAECMYRNTFHSFLVFRFAHLVRSNLAK